jgi:60 kDa SS-A/Ro ribonucleoprotein
VYGRKEKERETMANKSVFAATTGRRLPQTDTLNYEGAPAYRYGAEHKLAQLAMTGTFNKGFYGTGEMQVMDVVTAAESVDPLFLAQTAIYSRRKGYMKDAPALLLAVLSKRDAALFGRAFGQVIDNGKMLRNFVQIMRSGAAGRSSLGSAPKRQVQRWLREASEWQILNASVGSDPSLADVIKMVHPKPQSAAQEALFAWFMGKPCDVAKLPEAVQDLLRFRAGETKDLPDVPFQMLTAQPLTKADWTRIAERGSWQMLRMNINSFARHGVFESREATRQIALTLSNPEAVRKARAMPYQLMAAAKNVAPGVPAIIGAALVKAMEVAVANVPAIEGRVVICPDVSASMMWPLTGYRRGATSQVRCIDVAGLFAAALLRANADAKIMAFDTRVHRAQLRPEDTVFTNAERLAAYGGGGTDCSAPLVSLNRWRRNADLVLVISDNQSWAAQGDGRSTPLMIAWERMKRRNPQAKLVCIDIAPYATTQATTREDILNVGGYSDAVFDVIARFARGEEGAEFWTREIAKVRV